MALFSINTLVIFFGWLSYGLLHSLLASSKFKEIFKNVFPNLYSRYRLMYVLFAILSPLPLLYFQMSTESGHVWSNFREIRLFGGIMAGMGLAILRKAFALYDTGMFLGTKKNDPNSEEFKTSGLLAKMRHPLYTATLMIFWGWFLFNNSYQNLAFCLANTLYILVGIRWEEQKLIKQYGQKYQDYKAKTPMLVPKFGKSGN